MDSDHGHQVCILDEKEGKWDSREVQGKKGWQRIHTRRGQLWRNLCANNTTPKTFKSTLSLPCTENKVMGCYICPPASPVESVYITDVNEHRETFFRNLTKLFMAWSKFKTLCEIMGTFGCYQCIEGEGAPSQQMEWIIVRTHVDDLIGIAPTEEYLDNVEKSVEKGWNPTNGGRKKSCWPNQPT